VSRNKASQHSVAEASTERFHPCAADKKITARAARACFCRERMIQFSVSPFGPFLATYTRRKGNPMITQAFSVYLRRIFGLPMKEYFYIMFDDFVKSPTSVLRCILRHCDVL
jgi:hypothetical protein